MIKVQLSDESKDHGGGLPKNTRPTQTRVSLQNTIRTANLRWQLIDLLEGT